MALTSKEHYALLDFLRQQGISTTHSEFKAAYAGARERLLAIKRVRAAWHEDIPGSHLDWAVANAYDEWRRGVGASPGPEPAVTTTGPSSLPPDTVAGAGGLGASVGVMPTGGLAPAASSAVLAAAGGGSLVPRTGGGSAMVVLSQLVRLLPAAAVSAIRAAGGQWSRLPAWVRFMLTTIGIAEGSDILIDDGGGDAPAVPMPGSRGIVGAEDATDVFINAGGAMVDPQHGLVVHQWRANGVPFVKFADGYQAAWSAKRGWKYWRPKKPIVLTSSGAKDAATARRAYAALKNQAKGLKPMVDQFFPRRTRTRRTQERETKPDGTVVIRQG